MMMVKDMMVINMMIMMIMSKKNLNTVPGPHDLFHFGDVVVLFKDHHVIGLTSAGILFYDDDDDCHHCHHHRHLHPPELYSPLRWCGGERCQRRRHDPLGASPG